MNDNFNNIVWPGWQTVRVLGRGGFGAVYEIQRRLVGGTVEKAALKVISIPQHNSDLDEMFSDGQSVESVTKIIYSHMENVVAEYSLMRKMNGCANVVSCDDVRYIQHDDRIGWDIYIKMELLTPLTNALEAVVEEKTVLKIAKDLCNALVVCKMNNIVHRDIKPQNIFVSQYGDYKLGDFGIAKTMEKTTGGTKIGTYKYMAPEVYNNQPYSSTADIYSLGLVLYWLLNEHRLPFLPLPPAMIGIGMDEDARLRRLKGEKLPKPAHGSEALKAIVMKACEFNPKKRYQSAAEMLEALNSLEGKKTGAASRRIGRTSGGSAAKETGEGSASINRDLAESDRTVLGRGAAPKAKKSSKKKGAAISEKIIAIPLILYMYVQVIPSAIKEIPAYVVLPFMAVHALICIYHQKIIDAVLNSRINRIIKVILFWFIGLIMLIIFLIPLGHWISI